VSKRREYHVYILASRWRVLYVGVTNDLAARVATHRAGRGGDFTRRYRVDRLVYAEAYDDVLDAIRREKQIKSWSRAKKVALIEGVNPEWRNGVGVGVAEVNEDPEARSSCHPPTQIPPSRSG
jgi:putative endonuclease